MRRHGRVVKATDLKSVSFWERRFESYCLRPTNCVETNRKVFQEAHYFLLYDASVAFWNGIIIIDNFHKGKH